jgi:TolB protein
LWSIKLALIAGALVCQYNLQRNECGSELQYMLLRAYRLTDKLGIVLLKSSVALVDTSHAGVGMIVGAVRRILVGSVLSVLLTIGFALYRIVRRMALAVWSVIRAILSVLGVVGLSGLTISRRMTGQAATGAMARRAARAEMEAGLAEDPLRAQNRVLSGLAVVLLAVLISVVLWATGPARSSTAGIPSNQDINLIDATPGTAVASSPVALVASPIPTATALPSVIQVRGSLAYVVREKAQSDIWVVGVGTRAPLRLTNDPADDRDPAWSPDGSRLAFASHRDGNWEIYIYDMNSGETTRMTYDLSFQAGPQWSPDGQWLVYESYQGNNLDIYTIPLDNSQLPIRITDNPAPDFSPSWSPDGRRIAFVSWRDGNQDVYIFSLDDPRDAASINVTNTPTRQEDYPTWDPSGEMLAFSALDEGLEKVFVKPADDPETIAQVMNIGRTPAWSPDGASLVFAVDSVDSTHIVAAPFAAEGVATEVIPVPLGATDPTWTGAPLPAALVNSGGLGTAISEPLFIEQEARLDVDPPFRLSPLAGVEAPYSVLSERVDDSFNALREQTNDVVGWDFLGQLEDAFWDITRPPQPGEERRNWHMTGRAIAFNRNAIVGFPPPIEVVREDVGVYTYWRVYVRVSDEAQSGNLGEPLRRMPWDFASRNQGDVAAYDEGGRFRTEMPAGYYVDLTQVALDFGWSRVPAGSDWRANFNSTNYWLFDRRDGLSWYDAMRELYSVSQLGGFAPDATAIPIQQPTAKPGG